jgi:hypothetical protein
MMWLIGTFLYFAAGGLLVVVGQFYGVAEFSCQCYVNSRPADRCRDSFDCFRTAWIVTAIILPIPVLYIMLVRHLGRIASAARTKKQTLRTAMEAELAQARKEVEELLRTTKTGQTGRSS